jgi:hypothetical protein
MKKIGCMGKHNIRDKHIKGKQQHRGGHMSQDHYKHGKPKTRETITQGKKIKGEK